MNSGITWRNRALPTLNANTADRLPKEKPSDHGQSGTQDRQGEFHDEPGKDGGRHPSGSAIAFTMKLGPLPMQAFAPRNTDSRESAIRGPANPGFTSTALKAGHPVFSQGGDSPTDLEADPATYSEPTRPTNEPYSAAEWRTREPARSPIRWDPTVKAAKLNAIHGDGW